MYTEQMGFDKYQNICNRCNLNDIYDYVSIVHNRN